MQVPFAPRRTALLQGAGGESSREGRDCEWSHRATVRLLFPRLNARPGPWLLLLTAVCSFVTIRALEMAQL